MSTTPKTELMRRIVETMKPYEDAMGERKWNSDSEPLWLDDEEMQTLRAILEDLEKPKCARCGRGEG